MQRAIQSSLYLSQLPREVISAIASMRIFPPNHYDIIKDNQGNKWWVYIHPTHYHVEPMKEHAE